MDTTLPLQLYLHCISFPTFYQRMTITIAHARLNCVRTATEVTTLVEYMVQPTVKVSHIINKSQCLAFHRRFFKYRL